MKTKLKVLQITPSFGVGGAEKLVLEYLLNYNKENIEMRAVSLYGSSNSLYDNIIKEKNLDVMYLDKKPGLDTSMLKKINMAIDEYKPDIIHSHLHVMKYLIYAINKHKNIKCFHTIHSEPAKDAKYFDKFFNKLAFQKYSVTPIALSEKLAEYNNKYYKIANTKVVNNGVNLDSFVKDEKKRKDTRQALGISEDTFVIGHIGRFDKFKNQEFLVRVADKILQDRGNIKLLLIGDGELRKHIEEIVDRMNLKNNVYFLGARSDIPSLLNAMDVFVFPSLYEGFPITLIEAQAAGVRCVISDEIDDSCVLDESTIKLSLNDSLDYWSKIILESKNSTDKFIRNNNYDIGRYEIKSVLNSLEEIYRS